MCAASMGMCVLMYQHGGKNISVHSIQKAARAKELDDDIGQKFVVDCEELLQMGLKAPRVLIYAIISWLQFRSVPQCDYLIDLCGFYTYSSAISSLGPLVR